jgi:hypothetical protein
VIQCFSPSVPQCFHRPAPPTGPPNLRKPCLSVSICVHLWSILYLCTLCLSLRSLLFFAFLCVLCVSRPCLCPPSCLAPYSRPQNDPSAPKMMHQTSKLTHRIYQDGALFPAFGAFSRGGEGGFAPFSYRPPRCHTIRHAGCASLHGCYMDMTVIRHGCDMDVTELLTGVSRCHIVPSRGARDIHPSSAAAQGHEKDIQGTYQGQRKDTIVNRHVAPCPSVPSPRKYSPTGGGAGGLAASLQPAICNPPPAPRRLIK